MLEQIINMAQTSFASKYPHVQLPAAVLAKVTRSGDKINLKILNEFEAEDERFAEIPDLPSDAQWQVGDILVITFLYGKMEMPIILRRWNKCH